MKLSEAHFRARRRSFWRKIIVAGATTIIIAIALFTFIFWIKAVVVEVLPETAANKAQRTLDGWGWVQQDKVYLLSPEAELAISATGFISETITLIRDTLERRIIVELKEAPALITATATPADPQIQWRINAEPVGSGANLQIAVEPGSHHIEASHPYYQTQKSSVELARAEEKTLHFELAAVPGQINISSIPEGVAILLDDEAVGQTPITLARKGGTYRLRIQTPDFEMVDDSIEITYQQPTVNRNYRLTYKKASIDFTLTPPGGRLLIDGKTIAVNNAPLTVDTMRELIINYSKAGYFSKTIKRTFKPEQQENIPISLSAEFGEVIINTNPRTNIKINGKTIGATPQTLTLSAIPHTIQLSKPGYRTIEKTVQPSSQRTIQINETLLTEQQASLSESSAVYTNSAGIELVLFKPNKTQSFELGAHRSEKGQRANEILRTVRLDKAFYIARTEVSARHYHAFNPQTQASNLAINNITWNDAALFCNWLSIQEKLTPFYITDNRTILGYNPDSIGYRLPSEAEWEWLARYANRRVATQFIWGNQTMLPKNVGNLADESAKGNVAVYIPRYNDGYPKLAPIASFQRDNAGLHDLVGNVSEWMHDVYSVETTTDIRHNPLGNSYNTGRSGHVVKGSSWRSGTLSELRSAYRQRATDTADDRGFRIARYVY